MESKIEIEEKAEREDAENESIKNDSVEDELKKEFENKSTDIKIELKNGLYENFVDTSKENLKKEEETDTDIKEYVSVKREGNFTRSGYDLVDETEIFKGEENTLIMTQSYTHKFQCIYQLGRYPFDTQVRICLILSM